MTKKGEPHLEPQLQFEEGELTSFPAISACAVDKLLGGNSLGLYSMQATFLDTACYTERHLPKGFAGQAYRTEVGERQVFV